MPDKPDFGFGDKKLNKKSKGGAAPDPAAAFKGVSRKEEKAAAAEGKRAMQARARRGEEKVSWRKKAAGIGAILFLCGAGLMQAILSVAKIASGSNVHGPFDPLDTAKMKDVLFGGDPWVVYCVDNVTVNQRLPKFLEEGAELLHSEGVKLAVIPCWEKMASGKTLADRFKFRPKPPVMFSVVNGDSPKLLNVGTMGEGKDLLKQVDMKKMKPRISPVQKLKAWTGSCTSRRACVVLGYKKMPALDAAKKVMEPLLPEFRSMRVVSVDTSFWQVKLEDNLLAVRPQTEGKKKDRVEVFCLARGEGNSTFGGFYHEDELSAGGLRSFMNSCKNAGTELPEQFVETKGSPKIMARPTKPKVVTPEPYKDKSRPSPSPKPKAPPEKKRDYVGSRQKMEDNDEKIVEDVEENSEDAEDSSEGYVPEDGEADEEGGDDGEEAEEVEI